MEENVNGSKEQFDKLTAERDEYLNGWKRAKADLINYQKEEARRMEDVVKYANAGLIKELITVLDSFAALERSNEGEPRPDGSSGRDLMGPQMIHKQLEDVLKGVGIEKVAVVIGSPFDPNFHEAVAEQESDQPAGSIIEVLEKGYTLYGRVIRPARVKLSKGK